MSFPHVDRYGTQRWFVNGQPHREDGPAVVHPDGTELWFLNGLLHREDGPAVVYPNGTHYWLLNNNSITEEVEAWIERLELKPWHEWGDTEKLLFRVSF